MLDNSDHRNMSRKGQCCRRARFHIWLMAMLLVLLLVCIHAFWSCWLVKENHIQGLDAAMTDDASRAREAISIFSWLTFISTAACLQNLSLKVSLDTLLNSYSSRVAFRSTSRSTPSNADFMVRTSRASFQCALRLLLYDPFNSIRSYHVIVQVPGAVDGSR